MESAGGFAKIPRVPCRQTVAANRKFLPFFASANGGQERCIAVFMCSGKDWTEELCVVMATALTGASLRVPRTLGGEERVSEAEGCRDA